MCKFCENHNKLKVCTDFNINVDAFIETNSKNTPFINIEYTIDAGFLGYEFIDIEIPIKFCPYCGKELIVYSNEGSMKNNFQLIMVGGPYGDCTSSYEAYFDKPFKVKDFFSIVEEKKEEWGNIKLIIPEGWFNKSTSLTIEYKDGVLNLNTIFKYAGLKSLDILNANISKIVANGGWSCMDYRVMLEEP